MIREDRLYLIRKRLRGRWSDVEPFFRRDVANQFVRDYARELGAHWEGDELVTRNPRWDFRRQERFEEELRVRPDGDGLYPLGDFGRALPQALPLSEWEWKEVFPPWPERPLDPETIAALVETPLPRELSDKNRGPVLERVEAQADVPDLVGALEHTHSNDGRRIFGYMLAYHDEVAKAAPALPVLAQHFAEGDTEGRKHAAGAIAVLVSRLGAQTSLAAAPGLDEQLAEAFEHEQDERVRSELQRALGALGVHRADDRFVADALEAFAFLEREHRFPPPTVEDTGFSYEVRWRNDVVAVEASYEWRERWTDVWVVKLVDGALPAPAGGKRVRPTTVARVRADSELEAEAEALRRAPQLLRGEF